MADNQRIYIDDFTKWLKERVKEKGFKLAMCGFDPQVAAGTGHAIDLKTGWWEDPKYASPRWLYHLDATQGGLEAKRESGTPLKIGVISASRDNKAGAMFRVVPLIKQDGNDFFWNDALEIRILFMFHGLAPPGDYKYMAAVRFNPDSGKILFKGEPWPYIFAGLLGIQPRDRQFQISVGGMPRTVTYGDVMDALAKDIIISPQGGMKGTIPIFDLVDQRKIEHLKEMIENAWKAAGLPPTPATPAEGGLADEEDDETFTTILEHENLLGIDPAVYRQINAALASGKSHIMLYGPPGTGKTTLARHIATVLTDGKWTLVTGSSDWSSQDIIGGYQPVGQGSVAFIPGVLLRHFDRPLIIDELNRCDIDKVIGPLFTVLSGQQTTLPYRLKIEEKDSRQFTILPEPKPIAKEDHEFAPGPHWRLLATINSIDKAALYQMSYALARRFSWVYVDAPRDTNGFIREFLRKDDPDRSEPAADTPCPLGEFWTAINTVRVLGPAPVIDAIEAVRTMVETPDFFTMPDLAMKDALLDAVDMALLPMLDGIAVEQAKTLTDKAIEVFGLDGERSERIEARMASVAV